MRNIFYVPTLTKPQNQERDLTNGPRKQRLCTEYGGWPTATQATKVTTTESLVPITKEGQKQTNTK